MPGSFQNSGAIDVQGSGGGLFGGRMVTQAWNMDILGLPTPYTRKEQPDEKDQPPDRISVKGLGPGARLNRA